MNSANKNKIDATAIKKSFNNCFTPINKKGNLKLKLNTNYSDKRKTHTLTELNLKKCISNNNEINFFKSEEFNSKKFKDFTKHNLLTEETHFNTEPNQNLDLKEDEDLVSSYFTKSIKILEKIQLDFEMSARNNNIELKKIENNFVINECVSNRNLKNISSARHRNSISLHQPKSSNFIKFNFNREVAEVSENEKKLITQQMIENSENRIKNYSYLFNIINLTFDGIKESLTLLHNTKKIERKRFSCDESEIKKLRFQYEIENNNLIDEHVEFLKENLLSKRTSTVFDDSCDFSEFSITENAIRPPPKLENRSSLLKYREDVPLMNHEEEDLPDDDKTIIQYESLLLDSDDIETNNHPFINKAFDNLKKVQINQNLKNSTISNNTITFNTNENTNYTTLHNTEKVNHIKKNSEKCLIN